MVSLSGAQNRVHSHKSNKKKRNRYLADNLVLKGHAVQMLKWNAQGQWPFEVTTVV